MQNSFYHRFPANFHSLNRHVIVLIGLLASSLLMAETYDENRAATESEFEAYKAQQGGSNTKTRPQTNVADHVEDLPLSDPFGKKGSADKKPKPAATWRPLKDTGKRIKKWGMDTYQNFGSPKPITGPDGQKGLTFSVSSSVIGQPCSAGATTCINNERFVCRSHLEGKRMAYWWQRDGNCSRSRSVSDQVNAVPQANQKNYRQLINYRALYQQASPAVVAIYARQPGGIINKGTGSVINNSGLVLTNAHVVKDAIGEIDIYLKPDNLTGNESDLKQSIKARVDSINDALDLALLQIDITRLNKSQVLPEPLKLSDLNSVAIGEPTVAIGHPTNGAFWSMTTGHISGTFDNYQGVNGKDVFQTDTAINPGNSGGPLLDGSGRIIGINSFVTRQNEQGMVLEGLNFAIKSTTVLNWMDGLNKVSSSSTPPPGTINVVSRLKSSSPQHYVATQPSGIEVGGRFLQPFFEAEQKAFAELEAQ